MRPRFLDLSFAMSHVFFSFFSGLFPPWGGMTQEMSALEKETRLEAILPDTTSLCEKIAAKLRDLKELLEGIVDGQEEEQKPEVADELEMRMEADIFVLQQVRSASGLVFGH